jgi:hypothetical protein
VKTKYVTLLRLEQSQEGTVGVLLVNSKIICTTLELPWRNNKPYISCIPDGVYKCMRINSEKVKNVGGITYLVTNVPDRTGIIFHPGNWTTDSFGCILLGLYPGYLKNPDTGKIERAVLGSRVAFKRFMNEMNGERGFALVIRREDNG